jgi:hypothetical protein
MLINPSTVIAPFSQSRLLFNVLARGFIIPRYYFRLTDDKQVLDNHKGMNRPGDAATRDDAIGRLRDLRHGAAIPN